MACTKIFDFKNKRIINKEKYDYLLIKDYLINNLDSLFGVKLIGVNFCLSTNTLSNDNYRAQILGLEQEYKLTIFEFRKDKYGTLITNSFMMIDYIKEHVGIVKTLIKDKVPESDFSNINYNARLIVIGEDFSEIDNYALKQTPYEVDLIACNIFNNNLVINKMYSSFKVRIDNYDLLMKNKLFSKLHNDIMDLSSEINAVGSNNFINYRSIKNFCFVLISNEIKIYIRNNNKLNNYILNNDNYYELLELIKKAYEEN